MYMRVNWYRLPIVTYAYKVKWIQYRMKKKTICTCNVTTGYVFALLIIIIRITLNDWRERLKRKKRKKNKLEYEPQNAINTRTTFQLLILFFSLILIYLLCSVSSRNKHCARARSYRIASVTHVCTKFWMYMRVWVNVYAYFVWKFVWLVITHQWIQCGCIFCSLLFFPLFFPFSSLFLPSITLTLFNFAQKWNRKKKSYFFFFLCKWLLYVLCNNRTTTYFIQYAFDFCFSKITHFFTLLAQFTISKQFYFFFFHLILIFSFVGHIQFNSFSCVYTQWFIYLLFRFFLLSNLFNTFDQLEFIFCKARATNEGE